MEQTEAKLENAVEFNENKLERTLEQFETKFEALKTKLDAINAKLIMAECSAALTCGPKTLFYYSKGKPEDKKKAICWPDVKKHRLLLSDAFDLTCGRQLKHAQLCKQLAKWTSTHASTVAAFESLFLYQDVPHRGRLQGLQGQLTKEPSCRLKF